MKNLTKRIIALVLFSVLLVSMSGCGSIRSTSKLDDVTLVWYMQKPTSDMSHQSMVEEAANKIIYKELGVKLKF